MKILTLDLLAFGPFTNKTLDLSAGNCGLHLILGNNEAGKSSTLRALRQFLFGFPNTTRDDFLHASKHLRIGASIQDTSGAVYSLVRKKGRVNTLTDISNDTPVNESVLGAMLAGINQKVFENMFGISHQDLVNGGKAISQGEGELGAVLFSSSMNLDIKAILCELEESANAIFKPAGSNPKLNSLFSKLKNEKERLKESETPSAEWDKLNSDLAKLLGVQAENSKALLNVERRKSELKRLQEAFPISMQYKDLVASRDALGKVTRIPDGFELEVAEFRAKEDQQIQILRNLDIEIETLKLKLNERILNPKFVEQSAEVENHFKNLGRYTKAQEDRSKLSENLDSKKRTIFEDLKEIGLSPELEECELLQLTVIQRESLTNLIERFPLLNSERKREQQRTLQISNKICSAEEDLQKLPSHVDLSTLKAAAKRNNRKLEIESQLNRQLSSYEKKRTTLQTELNDLWSSLEKSYCTVTLDNIMAIVLPDENFVSESIIEHKTILDLIEKLEKEIRKDTARLEHLSEELRLYKEELATPVESELVDSKAKRDLIWNYIRCNWVDDRDDRALLIDLNLPGFGRAEVANGFAIAIESVDKIGNAMRLSASNVQRRQDIQLELISVNLSLKQTQGDLDLAKSRLANFLATWIESWNGAQLSPFEPKGMNHWLKNFNGIKKSVMSLFEEKQQLEFFTQEIETAKEDLLSACNGVISTLSSKESLEKILNTIDDFCDKKTDSNKYREQLTQDCQSNTQLLRDVEKNLCALDKDLEQWQEEWNLALHAAGLQHDLNSMQASIVLKVITQIKTNYAEYLALENRIKGIDRDALEFQTRTDKLIADLAADLNDLSCVEATLTLYERCKQSLLLKNETDNASFQLQKKEIEHLGAKVNLETTQGKLAKLCEMLDCPDREQLPTLTAIACDAKRLDTVIEQLHRRLIDLVYGEDLESFLERLGVTNFDQLMPSIEEQDFLANSLREQRTELDQAIGKQKAEIARIDGSSKAAEIAEESQQTIAEAVTQTEDYIRNFLAYKILANSIEKFREKNQNVLLKRAGEIFSRLTLNSFSGLSVEYSETKAALVGCRANSDSKIELSEMSEGTCDQLYLALRLASLEEWVHGNTPIPFIADDILINFDDARATETLKVLADLSQSTQIILFTHNAHIAELVKGSLHNDEIFIHDLNN